MEAYLAVIRLETHHHSECRALRMPAHTVVVYSQICCCCSLRTISSCFTASRKQQTYRLDLLNNSGLFNIHKVSTHHSQVLDSKLRIV